MARANIDVLKDPPALSKETFDEAQNSADPICVVPREGRVFGAVLRLPQYEGAYLFVAREVNPLAVEFPTIARAAAVEYLAIDSRRQGIQIAFASMFALIALIVLFSAIWFGLNFANRLVAPIRRLIHATDQVASGNFYAQVPVRKAEGDLAHLGETFNKMTSELRRQHDSLTAASDLIDRRRRFTEAVLSGVSAGVIGLDGRGVITIVNPSAETLLGAARETLVGAPIADAVPEIGADVRGAAAHAPAACPGADPARAQQPRPHHQRAGHERAGARRGEGLRRHPRRHHRPRLGAAHLGLGRRRPAHRPRDQEPADPDPALGRAHPAQVRQDDHRATAKSSISAPTTIVRQVDDIRRMVDEFSSFARMPKPTIGREDIVEIVRAGALPDADRPSRDRLRRPAAADAGRWPTSTAG